MSVRTAAIGEVALVNPRQPDRLPQNGSIPFVPMAAVHAEDGAINEERRSLKNVTTGYTYFEKGDVLVAKITPCFENGKIAHLDALSHPFGFGSTEFHVLRAGPGLDARYLYHVTRSSQFRRAGAARMTGSAGQQRVPAIFVASYRIPLPVLAEQRRIAAVLDKADSVRRKRRESVRLVDDVLRSAYANMVGPESPSYNDWPELAIGELAERSDGALRTGPFGSALRHAEFTDQGDVAVLGIDNVVENRFRWVERRFITRERYEKHFKRYTVRPGDVLVSIMGTTGKSAVVPDDVPLAISTKHLATISVNRERACPEYISHAIHTDPRVLAQIRSSNRGAIMSGLNLGIIRRLTVRLPPMSEQLAFVRVVEHTRSLATRLGKSLQMQERLFQSLAQRAFSGDVS